MPQLVGTTHFRCQPGRPVLCLLHAFPVNSDMWEPQLAFFEGGPVSVLAPDYPGFGQSSPFEAPPEMEDYARRLVAILNDLNLKQVTLAGLSMGGYVALAFLRLFPDRVNGLVLANTRATADSEATRQRRRQMIEEIRKSGSVEKLAAAHLELFFTERTRARHPDRVRAVQRMMMSASSQGVIHALQAMAGRADATEVLKQCRVPVLVITGQNDPLIPVDEARAMAELPQQARLAVLADSAHLSNLECPERFNEELQTFLNEIW